MKEELQNHFFKFENIIADLESTGASLIDADKVCHLLLTLPAENNVVVTTLKTLDQELTFDFVKSRLLDAELQLKGQQEQITENVQSFISCFKCGKKGHTSFQCRTTRDNHTNRGRIISRGIGFREQTRGPGLNSHNTKWQSSRVAHIDDEAKMSFTTYQEETSSASDIKKFKNSSDSVQLVIDSGATEHLIMAEYKQYMFNISLR